MRGVQGYTGKWKDKMEELSPEERQTGFNDMISIALDTAARMKK